MMAMAPCPEVARAHMVVSVIILNGIATRNAKIEKMW